MGRIDLQDLHYFVVVCDRHSILRASLVLHTSQSNVSARIKKLEDSLGVQLLIRGRRGVATTEKGSLLYAYAKRVLLLMEETEKAVAKQHAA